MKKCSLILFFIFFVVEYSNAQSPIIDSVVVRHCLIRDIGEYEYNASIVDSFNTDEETKIRKDPMARVSDLLKKVFGP